MQTAWRYGSVSLLLIGCAAQALTRLPNASSGNRTWSAPAALKEPTAQLQFGQAPPEQPITIASPRPTLQVGERLQYHARWMGIPVGEGSVEVKEIVTLNDRQAFHIVGEAHSNRWLSRFYPLKDIVHSYVDVEALHPLRFEKSQREGHYRSEEVVTFDHTAQIATYESLINRAIKEHLGEAIKQIPIPVHIQDPLSVFYALRLRPLEVGTSLNVDVYSDEKSYRMEVQVLDTRRLELRRRGVFDVITLEPIATFKGLLVERGRVVVYLTADEWRIPLAIYIWTPWGLVTGVIERASLQPIRP